MVSLLMHTAQREGENLEGMNPARREKGRGLTTTAEIFGTQSMVIGRRLRLHAPHAYKAVLAISPY